MATIKVPNGNGGWTYVTDPSAERFIVKSATEPTAEVGSLWIDTSDSSTGTGSGIGVTASISLTTAWTENGEDEYLQSINLSGIPTNSKVDLMPDTGTLSSLISSGSILCVSNDGDNEFTCHCYGNKPTEALIIPIFITEVNNSANALIMGNSVGALVTPVEWGSWNVAVE